MFLLELSLRHILILSKLLDATLLGPADARKHAVIAALDGVPEDDELVSELNFAIQAENEGGKATWLECFSTKLEIVCAVEAYHQRYDVAVSPA
jgi:hypothetical protein